MHRSKRLKGERFSATLDANVKETEASLCLRRVEMIQAWDDLDKRWKDLEQRMLEIGLVKPLASDDEGIASLNVGGSHVHVPHPVFEGKWGSCASWALTDVFAGVCDKRLPRDSDGCILPDESPACVKPLASNIWFIPSSRALGENLMHLCTMTPLPMRSRAFSTSRALGLPDSVVGMAVTGGSTILETNMSCTIQRWCPGRPDELELLYRASRDGWTGAAFHDRCVDDSPSTITLFRVKSRNNNIVSIVGGFSTVAWTPPDVAGLSGSCGAFLFMLKSGRASGSTPFEPVKWGLHPHGYSSAIYRAQESGPTFGAGHDLGAKWTENGATLTARKRSYSLAESPLLMLDGLTIEEIETFRVCPKAATARPLGKPDAYPTAFAEEHRNDADTFGKLVAGSLMGERMVLHEAEIELVEASDKVSASANAFIALYGPGVSAGKEDPVVELSVRGSRVTTLLSTLQVCPESVWATMFNEDRWPATDKDVDEHRRRLIDCRPSVFAKVLDVLRMRKRAGWIVLASQQQHGPVRVIIKAGDRDSFEEFLEKHFPRDLQSFIMDCVEPTTGSR